MRPLYIIGAGGFGKEVLFLLNEINASKEEFKFAGFIDKEDGELTLTGIKHPIFAEETLIKKLKDNSDVSIAIAIGTPSVLKKVAIKWKDETACNFPNLIHPNFRSYRETITFGEGNIICSGCTFPVDITMKSFNIFNLNVTLGHDSVMGSYNIVNPGANISGETTFGNENLVGTNATILQGLTIQNDNTIGAGSMLTRDVESGQTVIGNPARVMRQK